MAFKGQFTILFLSTISALAFLHAKPPPASPPTPEKILSQERPSAWPDWLDVEMDSSVLQNDEHRNQFAAAFNQAPSLMIEAEVDDLFGPDGLYLLKDTREDSPEIPATLTYHHPIRKGFTIRCGLQTQGRGSRSQSPKRNFRLKFTKKHGPASLNYPLYNPDQSETFENLLIRNPTHDSWTIGHPSWRVAPRYINDRWANETARELGHPAPRQQWVHLFLNQIYWGLYALSERPDEHFAALYFKKGKDSFDVFNAADLRHGTANLRGQAEDFLLNHFQNTPEIFEQLNQHLNLPAFLDHFICQIYQGKTDWPSSNYTLIGHRNNAPRFYFLPWDSETGFYHKPLGIASKQNALTYNPLGTYRITSDHHGPGFWYHHLATSEEFRLQLADRLHALTSPGGVLSPEIAALRYQNLLKEITPLLFPESCRWGDACREKPYMPYGEEWDGITNPQSWLFTTFFLQRPDSLKQYFREHDIWPHLDPPICFLRQKPDQAPRLWIRHTNPKGVMTYTTDGSDPRTPWTGKPSDKAKAFREPLILPPGTVVKTRVLSYQKWSALTTFRVE